MNNQIDICEELGRNFLTYALDVDQNKAFPAVADGLAPGARAALWEMYTCKYFSNKPHVKSAKVASGVIGKWWPHNADATYGTLVRMAQPFVENCLEVDFQGAVGNQIIGQDSAGSSRYTEMRLSKLAEEGIFKGINKNNSEMIWNYLQDEQWPKVFPSVFPRLLVNGHIGLGVGLSTLFTLHNFKETAKLIIDYLETGIVDNDNYYPDFPTGGTIINKDELSIINKTGKGKIVVQGKYKIENNQIIFYEFPYQVYIEPLIAKIKEKYNDDKLPALEDVINSSDKNSISITITVNNDYTIDQCLNQLFANTPLQSIYYVNQNAIIDQVPEMVNLETILKVYEKHNTECIKKENLFDYNAAIARIEILQGLSVALEDIDNVIKIIKESKNATLAKANLIEKYHFSTVQAEAILNMKLSRLANMEKLEVEKELKEKEQLALQCKEIIDSSNRQKQILIERLRELANKFGTERRTEVIQKEAAKNISAKKQEELPQDVVICLTKNGYFKNIPKTQYKTNVDNVFAISTTTLNMIYAFSNMGKVYRLLGKDIPTCGARDKGAAAGSILQLQNNEKIIFVCDIDKIKNKYIMFITKNGKAKKTSLTEYIGVTRNFKGAPAIKFKEEDELLTYLLLDEEDVMLTSNTHYICFNSNEITPQGKVASGLQAMNLKEGEQIVKAEVLLPNAAKKIVRQHRNGVGIKI